MVAGLQPYVPRDVMQGLAVVTVCNLKPAKLAGQMSEAMILAASCMDGETRIVKTLKPADGSAPGERVCSHSNDTELSQSPISPWRIVQCQVIWLHEFMCS